MDFSHVEMTQNLMRPFPSCVCETKIIHISEFSFLCFKFE